MGEETPSKIDLQYADSKIIFTISSCSTNKKFSFFDLTRDQAETLVYRLQYFEKLTWKQLGALGRIDGLTVESVNSDSYKKIDDQNHSEKKIFERYYFHMRIEKRGAFRIFGYQSGQCFCITHIDPKHSIHD